MAYSFIETSPKSPFSAGVRKVWLAGAVLAGTLLAVSGGLHLYGKEEAKALQEAKGLQKSLGLQIGQLKQQQAQFESEKMLLQQAHTANQLLADQVADLLGLVPNDAVLSRFALEEATVRYEGKCRDYNGLQRDLTRSLASQYRLEDSQRKRRAGMTRFVMHFSQTGEPQ